MKVREHTAYDRLLIDDPAQFARERDLVGNHDHHYFPLVGAWRWPLISKHEQLIKQLLQDDGYAIDFGGAAAPVGFDAVVVDYQARPPDGPRSLMDVPPDPSTIFCSHTLEHLVDPDHALICFREKLRAGGHLIIQVPSYKQIHLHPKVHEYHQQVFCFAADATRKLAQQVGGLVLLDTKLSLLGFEIELMDQDDACLLIIARKPDHG